jgi:hypothetical protein
MNLFSRQLGRRPHKGFGVFSVKVEKEFQPLQLRFETCRAVAEIDGGIKRPVGVDEANAYFAFLRGSQTGMEPDGIINTIINYTRDPERVKS